MGPVVTIDGEDYQFGCKGKGPGLRKFVWVGDGDPEKIDATGWHIDGTYHVYLDTGYWYVFEPTYGRIIDSILSDERYAENTERMK